MNLSLQTLYKIVQLCEMYIISNRDQQTKVLMISIARSRYIILIDGVSL